MFSLLWEDPSKNVSRESLDYLVARAREGDVSAFEALFERFNRPICTYLARLLDNEDVARDLAQETFLQAWKGLPRLQGELTFRAWLYRIATNLASSHLRRQRLIGWLPWLNDDREESHRALSTSGPEESVVEADLIAQVLACLTRQYKACLLLQVVGGFSQREVACMLGISERSVGANVCRGREQFRRHYHRLKGAPL